MRAAVTGTLRVDAGSRHRRRAAWCIEARCQDPATRKPYVFRSDPLAFDPGPHLQGGWIDVRIDPADPRRYMMDTRFLPGNG